MEAAGSARAITLPRLNNANGNPPQSRRPREPMLKPTSTLTLTLQIYAVFFRHSGGEAGVSGGRAVDFLSRAPLETREWKPTTIATPPRPCPRPRPRSRFRFLRYFSGKAVGKLESPGGKQSIFCLVPHGVFPFGIALSSLGRRVYICYVG